MLHLCVAQLKVYILYKNLKTPLPMKVTFIVVESGLFIIIFQRRIIFSDMDLSKDSHLLHNKHFEDYNYSVCCRFEKC